MLHELKKFFCSANFALLLTISTSSTSALAEDSPPVTEYQLIHNEDYGVLRNLFRLWVEYENLPAPELPLSPTDNAKLANVWTRLRAAGDNVESAWQQAFRSDPLLQQALTSYNRGHELEWQFQTLRRGIRRQYGFDKYREFKKRGGTAVLTDGKPWLDLGNENLVRLMLWFESLHLANVELLETNDIPIGILPPAYYVWLKTTEPYAQEILDFKEELTETRAVEIYLAGIRHERANNCAKNKKLDEQLDLPPGMRQCLRLQTEVNSLYVIGETYLQVNLLQHESIAKAKADFERLLEIAQAIRPDVLVALYQANRKMLEKQWQNQLQNQKRQRESLLLALHPRSKQSESPGTENGTRSN